MEQYPVKYSLMNEFRELAVQEGCVVKNVVEQIGRQLIVYILEVPDGKDDLISDMAFMTFIKNPKFQKYYTLTDEILTRIKEDDEFFEWAKKQPKEKTICNVETLDEQLLARLILDGIYPLYNNETGEFSYLKNANGFYFGTSQTKNFNDHWKREIFYLGEGQLDEAQRNSIMKIDRFKTIESLNRA